MPLDDPPIRIDYDEQPNGRVACVTMDFDGKLNVLNTAVNLAFVEVLDELAKDDSLRVVLLRGTERAFIGGADIKEMAGLNSASAREFITNLHRVCQGIRDLPVPVIAQVRGYCLGGGLEVAAACDMRVAAEDATFGMPEVQVGVPSVIEAALLPALIGWGKTRELLLTGRMFNTAEALQMGFVERIAPRERLNLAASEWIDSILNAAPQAVRLQKSLIREWETQSLEQAIQTGVDYFQKAYESGEPNEFMQRFLNSKSS